MHIENTEQKESLHSIQGAIWMWHYFVWQLFEEIGNSLIFLLFLESLCFEMEICFLLWWVLYINRFVGKSEAYICRSSLSTHFNKFSFCCIFLFSRVHGYIFIYSYRFNIFQISATNQYFIFSLILWFW